MTFLVLTHWEGVLLQLGETPPRLLKAVRLALTSPCSYGDELMKRAKWSPSTRLGPLAGSTVKLTQLQDSGERPLLFQPLTV